MGLKQKKKIQNLQLQVVMMEDVIEDMSVEAEQMAQLFSASQNVISDGIIEIDRLKTIINYLEGKKNG